MSDQARGSDRHEHEHARDHGHGDGHSHEHGGHSHEHGSGVLARIRHVVRPHSHDAADKVDAAMEASAEGMRALWISLAVLAATAVFQAIVVALSGSVALLGDTLHNGADALTACRWASRSCRPPPADPPLHLRLRPGRGPGRAGDRRVHRGLRPRWPPMRRSTGWPTRGRSATWPSWRSRRVIGFAGNELVARYRIRTGRRIGSAALVADGLHARTDGFTSLAVLLGAGGVAVGWNWADPVVGLADHRGDSGRAVAGRPRDLPPADGRRRPGAGGPGRADPASHPRRAGRGPGPAAVDRPSAPRRMRDHRATATPPPSRRTRSPWTPSTTCCTQCRG